MRLQTLFGLTVIVSIHLGTRVEAAVDKKCLEWFIESKIEPAEKCEWKCASAPVDMGTFSCGSHCTELCRIAKENAKIPNVEVYIPYLNSEEIKLSTKYPKEAWIVYQQKLLAEKATILQFGRDDPDDESDAFRHFVWAGLLSKELGPELAKTFLDAHEADESVASSARAIDLANNRAGLFTAETLRKKNSLDHSELKKHALQALKKTLVVISPKEIKK